VSCNECEVFFLPWSEGVANAPISWMRKDYDWFVCLLQMIAKAAIDELLQRKRHVDDDDDEIKLVSRYGVGRLSRSW
jgi:hypothetical protein